MKHLSKCLALVLAAALVLGLAACGKDTTGDDWRASGVVTDYGTIGELKAHGVAGDDAQAAELALRAGVNMDMMSAAYLFHAAELVREGRIPESLIDSLCCEVLAVKFRLGLFDDPFRY